jgi:CHAT domain-containing protein
MESSNSTEWITDPATIRRFLLGSLEDEVVLNRLERDLLASDEFGEIIGAAEGSLIEDYLDGRLSSDEVGRFETLFLASPERRQQVRIISRLRDLGRPDDSDPSNATGGHSSRLWQNPFFGILMISLVLVISIVSVWRWSNDHSETEIGIAELRSAYQSQRPMLARVAALPEYHPFNEVRGSGVTVADPVARDRAAKHLLDGVKESSTSTSHRNLATLYLTDKKYDQALAELGVARDLSPRDASIEADIGAVYFEMARSTGRGSDSLVLIDKSLGHLDAALALNPRLPQALYNKALCLQLAFAPDQARDTWNDYLSVDPDSPWASEARSNLQQLNTSAEPKDRSAEDIEQNFIEAIRTGNDQEAMALLANNHELVREKYLPERLAASYAGSNGGRGTDGLAALKQAGRLEQQRSGDAFAMTTAEYYSKLAPDLLYKLRDAHKTLIAGFQSCMASDYASAYPRFEQAHSSFLEAHDKPEAEIATYLAGYALVNSGHTDDAVRNFDEVRSYAKAHRFLWLEAVATYWSAGARLKLSERTQALDLFKRSLQISEVIGDQYTKERNLLELAQLNAEMGQHKEAVEYLSQILRIQYENPGSLRQKYRDLSVGLDVLTDSSLPHVAKAIALDCVTTADASGDHVWAAESRDQAAYTVARTDDFPGSRGLLNDAEHRLSMIDDPSTRARLTAFTQLSRGEVATLAKDEELAERSYRSAAEYYDNSDLPYFRQRAQMGFLRALNSLGRTEELEQQIPKSIAVVEAARRQILDEQERGGFLDTNENVYDIAMDFESRRGNTDRALEYAEASSSRSLLDWMEKGGVSKDANRPHFLSGEVATPLSLSEIRAQLPTNTQVLKYAVLENQLLVWMISRDRSFFTSVPVSQIDLYAKTAAYERLVSASPSGTNADKDRLGSDLYQLLLAPVRASLAANVRICIIPSKGLFSFPFAALPLPEGSWLVAEYPIFYSPSINVLLNCTERARGLSVATDEALLAIGNPTFEKANYPDVSHLPNAEQEVAGIARQYPRARVLVGPDATKTKFLAALNQADVVHFAGHYFVSDGAPGSSFMLLARSGGRPSEEVLTNDELLRQAPLKPKLIILAACRSGVEATSPGEGLIGLSRTFLEAGVPIVVGTQWDVDSEGTTRLMQDFHSLRRTTHLPTVEALQKAQMQLANDPTGRFSDPYYWAGFMTIGASAQF